MSSLRRAAVLAMILAAAFCAYPQSAHAAWMGWAYNYGIEWRPYPWLDYNPFPAATTASVFQTNMEYEAKNYDVAWASDVYNKFDNVALIYLASHSSPGSFVFRNTGRATPYSCLRGMARATVHQHNVAGQIFPCNHQRALRDRPGTSPTKLVLYQGCQTGLEPSSNDRGLLWASYYEGVQHSAGFDDQIVIAFDAGREFSYGYWQSLKDGNYTLKAAYDGQFRTRWLVFAGVWAGGYDSYRYWGSNIRVD